VTVPKKPAVADKTDDQPVPENERPESPARTRTRLRMHQLLLTATALGAGASEPEQSIVCDPPPPPLTCPRDGSMRRVLFASASWTQVNASLLVRVGVTYHDWQGDVELQFAGDPRLTGASLARLSRHATRIEFDCVPNAGAAKITVFVPMTCNAKNACYQMELDVRQPQAKTKVPITVIKTGC
jgi:hypothetical protein